MVAPARRVGEGVRCRHVPRSAAAQRPGDRRRLRHRIPGVVPRTLDATRGRRATGAGGRHSERPRRVDGRTRRHGAGSRSHGHLPGAQAGSAVRRRAVPVRRGRRSSTSGSTCRAATSHLVDAGDVAAWFPQRPVDAHKWSTAVRIVAGSPGMLGAAGLAARGATRCGAGLVSVSSPGGSAPVPLEVLQPSIPDTEWADEVLDGLTRHRALVVGPGLGRTAATVASIRRVIARAAVPVVIDGDALHADRHGWPARTAPIARRRPSSPRTTASSSSSPGRRPEPTGSRPPVRLASRTRLHRAVEGAGDGVADRDGRCARRRPR